MVWVLPRRRVRWLHTCHGNNSRETPTQKYRSFGCETSEHRLHGIISDFDIPMDLSMQKKPFDNLRSLALVDEEGELELLRVFTYSFYCLLYTSPSPRDGLLSRMPSSA